MSSGRQTLEWADKIRLGGLRRFAFSLTVLNLLGHSFLGFEQPYAQPIVSVLAACTLELILEFVQHWSTGKPLGFLGEGAVGVVNFFMSAYISGLAVGMLLYPNARIEAVVFAAAVAVASKRCFQVSVDGRTRHFLNPSNFGITITLLCFPWVGIAPPYQFTENLVGASNFLFPAFVGCIGIFLNLRYTGRLPLISAWLGTFAAQAFARHLIFGTALLPALLPMTGFAFLLFTLYMVTDPPTTPKRPLHQVCFGASVALVYGALMSFHMVFGLFFSLAIVCVCRGVGLTVWNALGARADDIPASNARTAMTGERAS